MKIAITLTLYLFLACSIQKPAVDEVDNTEITDQEATVETHVVSRGKFQYVLLIESGPHAGKYLPEKVLPDAYCRDKMKVIIDGKVLDQKGMVYKPGPTDIPETNFEIPMIRVDKVRNQE